jgi:hypothetical protein
MVDDLDDRLSDDDLNDLARYSRRLSRANSTAEAIKALRRIDNPEAVAAIGAAAFGCISGLTL